MKDKKILKIALIIMLVILSGVLLFGKTSISKVKADSGFDSSYDSGSYDSGSYDFGSSDFGSSWDDDSYGSSHSSGGIYGFGSGIIIFIVIIIVAAVVLKNNPNLKNGNIYANVLNSLNLGNIQEISDEKLRELIPNFNKETFKKERYEDYLKIQNAWMNFDYDTLRKMLTDELYNQYEMQLDTLKVKNQKNVMSDFTYVDSKITGISSDNDKISVTVDMIVSFYDYITQNDSVVRGNKNAKITQHYEMVFVCNINNKVSQCPNCGAKLDNSASKKCDYCGSIIVGLSDKWVLSKKESKNQR